MKRLCLAVGVLGLGIAWNSASVLPAQESDAPAPQPSVEQLIKQLDSPKFGDRQTATLKLSELGRDAIPALAAAATGPSREASTRSLDILKKHLQSQDEATQKAAREALEKLAQSELPRVAAAATDALKPKAGGNDLPNGALPVPIQVIPGQVQIQVQAIGGIGGRRVSVQNINGVKTTTVEENNRKVKIVDDPQNGLKLEVTEKVDGKEQTKKYEAKDADDLKKKHPDAHKIYEQNSQPQQNIQIQFGGGAIPALPAIPLLPAQRAVPLPGLPVPDLRANPKLQDLQEQLERVQKDLKSAQEKVKKAAEGSPQAEQLGKAVEQLDAIRKQVDESLEKLKSP